MKTSETTVSVSVAVDPITARRLSVLLSSSKKTLSDLISDFCKRVNAPIFFTRKVNAPMPNPNPIQPSSGAAQTAPIESATMGGYASEGGFVQHAEWFMEWSTVKTAEGVGALVANASSGMRVLTLVMRRVGNRGDWQLQIRTFKIGAVKPSVGFRENVVEAQIHGNPKAARRMALSLLRANIKLVAHNHRRKRRRRAGTANPESVFAGASDVPGQRPTDSAICSTAVTAGETAPFQEGNHHA